MGPLMDSKRISVILAGKLGDKKPTDKPAEDKSLQPDVAAAKALVAAIEKKDFEKIVSSFKNLMECCDLMDSSEDDESEDME